MSDDQQNLDANEELEVSEAQAVPAEESVPECPHCVASKAEAAEYKSGWQRAVADYKNLQKETTERRQMLFEMSEQYILEEFIPVYDNFKLAFRLQTTDYSPEQQKWVEGIKHIMKQFGDILKQHKVEEIKTVGEKFDPTRHEAVGEAPSSQSSDGIQSDGVSAALREPGTIIREVDGGYTMGGRVIKAAKVIISKS